MYFNGNLDIKASTRQLLLEECLYETSSPPKQFTKRQTNRRLELSPLDWLTAKNLVTMYCPRSQLDFAVRNSDCDLAQSMKFIFTT